MKLTINQSELCGIVKAPPSKSQTQREFIISALSKGTSEIHNPLFCEDTNATLECVKKLGAEVVVEKELVKIKGGTPHVPSGILDCKNSATTLRVLTAVAAKMNGTVKFTGDESLCKRPMQPLLDALVGSGAKVVCENGFAPLSVTGPAGDAEISVVGNISSQFISGLLIAAPLSSEGLKLRVTTQRVSQPYIEMTVESMKNHRVNVFTDKTGYFVSPNQCYSSASTVICPDFSSAAYLLTAGALTGEITVTGISENETKGDASIVSILGEFGAEIKRGSGSITVSKSELTGTDLDLSNTPDLFSIICVAASLAKGVTRIVGAPHLRFKESDRIATTVEFLKKMGADISETDDGCVITGKKHLKGATINSYADHRVAMAATIAGLCAEGKTVIDDVSCVSVSYPKFLSDIKKLKGDLK